MKNGQEPKSKSANFKHFFLLATLLYLSKKLPVFLLEYSIIPCIQSRTLVIGEPTVIEILSRMISSI